MISLNDNILDFTKKEDLTKLKNVANELKDDNNALVSLAKLFIGNDYNKYIDKVVDNAQKIYDNANKNNKKVIDKSVTTEPTRPSEKTAEEMQKQIANLVAEYMNTKILPNAKLFDKQSTSIADGLFEFACWIYNR